MVVRLCSLTASLSFLWQILSEKINGHSAKMAGINKNPCKMEIKIIPQNIKKNTRNACDWLNINVIIPKNVVNAPIVHIQSTYQQYNFVQ